MLGIKPFIQFYQLIFAASFVAAYSVVYSAFEWMQPLHTHLQRADLHL